MGSTSGRANAGAGPGIPGVDGAVDETADVVDLDPCDLDPLVTAGGPRGELQLGRFHAQQLGHQGQAEGCWPPPPVAGAPPPEGGLEGAFPPPPPPPGGGGGRRATAPSAVIWKVLDHGPYFKETRPSGRGQGGDLPYPDVEPQPNLPKLEDGILAFWADDGTFQASIDQRPAGPDGSNEFVFYDGPPFANGLPHYGHLLTGYVKDVVPRYQTMRGRRVERRFGWDCHGLPAEMEAEKELGITTKAAIVEYGIDRFNDYCRTSVLRYTQEWEPYVTRQARWVDFDNDYKTMDLSYMESVMWAFKQLWDKGLIYEGYRVLPYCWECETPLSNFETRLDDAYRDRQDPAVTVVVRARRRRAAGSWCGPPRRGRCRRTSPSPSGPTSTTPSSRRTAPAT